ncbi:MAG: MMPL family transporter [Halobacteriovoraceae bacterium]|nr:MMPL family transporter [Halobacteriovoraceae bacterium]
MNKINYHEKYKSYKWANKWSNFIVDKPLKAMGLFFLAILIMFPGILSIESKWSPRIWFDEDHPQIQKLNRFESQFGSDTFISLGVYHPDGIFQEKILKSIYQITEKMWTVKDVIRVESLSNYNIIRAEEDDIIINPFVSEEELEKPLPLARLKELKEEALTDDVLPDFFLSGDTTYTIIYAYLIPGLNGKEPNFTEAVAMTRNIANQYRKDGVKIFLTGPAAGNDAFREVSASDNKKLIPFMFGFIVLLLFVQFRSRSVIILALGLIGATIGVTFGAMGHTGIVFNSLLAAIPGVLLAICIADAVHIFTGYFYFRGQSINSLDSIRFSLVKNFQPTLLTSISTAISFFSITHTDIAPIRDLGLLSGFGTAMAWLFTYLMIGPLLALFSPKLDKYKTNTFEFYKLLGKNKSEQSKWDSSKLMVDFIYKYRFLIIIVFLVFSSLSVVVALRNEVNSDPMKYFHKTVPIRKAYDFTGTKLDGLRGIELVVDAGKAEGIKEPEFLNRLDSYMKWLVKDPDITRVRSAREIVKKMNQTLHQGKEEEYRIPDSVEAVGQLLFLYTIGLPQGMDLNNQFTLDNRRLRIRVTWKIETSKESEIKSDEILAKAKDFNLNVETGGNAPIYLSMNQLVVDTFFSSMAMALCLVSFLLYLVYKDIFISLLAMLPNLIPLLFGGALMQLLNKPIDIGTSIVSTVCLGIAVDDTIHFVSSYKQYRNSGLSPLDAITETFLITGKALVVTTVLLVMGFGAFVFGEFVPNRNFGMLCSMVLALALLTDLLFLPALLLVIDQKAVVSEKSDKDQGLLS